MTLNLFNYPIDEEYLMDSWYRGNKEGRGFPVGEEDDHIEDIEGEGKLIGVLGNDEYAVYLTHRPKTVVIVADANGPWAVDVTRDVYAWINEADYYDKMRG